MPSNFEAVAKIISGASTGDLKLFTTIIKGLTFQQGTFFFNLPLPEEVTAYQMSRPISKHPAMFLIYNTAQLVLEGTIQDC